MFWYDFARLYRATPVADSYYMAMKSCGKSQDLNTCYDVRQELIRDLPGSEQDLGLDCALIECMLYSAYCFLAYGYAGDVTSAERVWKPILDDMIANRRKADGIPIS
jgi:hypothetical protein